MIIGISSAYDAPDPSRVANGDLVPELGDEVVVESFVTRTTGEGVTPLVGDPVLVGCGFVKNESVRLTVRLRI